MNTKAAPISNLHQQLAQFQQCYAALHADYAELRSQRMEQANSANQ